MATVARVLYAVLVAGCGVRAVNNVGPCRDSRGPGGSFPGEGDWVCAVQAATRVIRLICRLSIWCGCRAICITAEHRLQLCRCHPLVLMLRIGRRVEPAARSTRLLSSACICLATVLLLTSMHTL